MMAATLRVAATVAQNRAERCEAPRARGSRGNLTQAVESLLSWDCFAVERNRRDRSRESAAQLERRLTFSKN